MSLLLTERIFTLFTCLLISTPTSLGGILPLEDIGTKPISVGDWLIEVIENELFVGGFVGLQIGPDDFPHVEYSTDLTSNLFYGKRNETRWHRESVDDGGNVRDSEGLAVGPDGTPHICYVRSESGVERLKHTVQAQPGWGSETVEKEDEVTQYCSIFVDDSNEYHISYQTYSTGKLWYAHYAGTEWSTEVVDESFNVGRWSSMVLGPSGVPSIAYEDYQNHSIRYAVKESGKWNISVANPDQESGGSRWPSLDFDDNGKPHITYVGHGVLKMTSKNGAKWDDREILPFDAPQFPHMKMSSSGVPHIVYWAGNKLNYTTRPQGQWLTETLMEMELFGTAAAIDLDSKDKPHLAFTDHRNGFLYYATKANFSANLPPVADAGPDQTVHVGDLVQFDGSGSYDPDGGWFISTVDFTGNVGISNSITLDEYDRPHISYHDRVNDLLKYARWTGSAWIIEIVDDEGGSEGTYIALNANSQPFIVYYGRINTETTLKYANWTGSTWNKETLDNGVGYRPSIVLDSNGYPHIAYKDGADDDLEYVKWTGSAWSYQTVDAIGNVGARPSIALDSNEYPHFSHGRTNVPADHDLRYARWTGSGWSTATVDYSGDVGTFSSLALDDDDHPHIAYEDGPPNGNLKYAQWTGSAWKIEIVDSAFSVGQRNSLALDKNGRAHISYFDSYGYDLRYARWTGSEWVVEIVDWIGDVGWDSSIDVDSHGLPHISYYDGTNYDLKYAKKNDYIISYDWDFGDGSPHGSGIAPTHVYNYPGIYNVNLTVTDTYGATGTDNCVITVLKVELPPVADAGPDQTVDEGDTVFFDGTGSHSPGGVAGYWLPKTDDLTQRSGGGSATLNGEIYYVGGDPNDCIIEPSPIFRKYNPATDTWFNLTDLPVNRVDLGAAAANGKIYALGGNDGIDSTNTTFEFDPATNKWTSKASFPVPMESFGTASVNNRVYVIGGYSTLLDCYPCGSVFEYNPLTDTWSTKPDMPTGRARLAATVVKDEIYAIGGDAGESIGTVEVYDTVTESWTTRTNMTTARSGLSAEVLGEYIYAIGGTETWGLPVNISEMYDPSADAWFSAPSMLEERKRLGSGVVGNCLYAIGGVYSGLLGPMQNGTEAYCLEGELDYEWDFDASVDSDGDGNYTNDVDATGPTPTHVYGDNGKYTVTLKVIDDAGLWDTDTCVVTVLNVPPTANADGPYDGLEGSPIEFTGDHTDPGFLDTHTYEWDFDYDGITFTPDVTGTVVQNTWYDDHSGDVALRVTDDDGGWGIDVTNVTVLNVPPKPEWTSKSADGTIVNPPYPEGKEIQFDAIVEDPGTLDTFTYDWDFGDGTIVLDAGPSVTHAYGDNDTYIVVLKVTDDDGGVGIDDTPPLLTTNEDPVASISLPRCPFFEGRSCPIEGYFTDPGWLDTHSAVWNFGDGEYEIAVITEENEPPNATGSNRTVHIYGDDGDYNITFTVVDDDGGSDTTWAIPYVLNVPPSLVVDVPFSVEEGKQFNLSVKATDPGSDDIFINVDWGDGTSEKKTYYNDGIGPDPPNSGPGVYPFIVYANFSHIYGDNGNFNVTVKAEDDDDGMTTNETTITVNNVSPSIAPFGPFSVDEGIELELNATATDPGSDDLEFTWKFEMGPTIPNVYYNDGVGPDPYPSPEGNYPFEITDEVQHTYGDNGVFNVTLTVEDDDGGNTTYKTNITVYNLEPTIAPFGPFTVDEGSPLEFNATATDPGSDDLTFTWVFEYGPTLVDIHYNDGIGPDPYPSPRGKYPFEITGEVQHTYGDNGVFNVTLAVEDDDGGTASYTTTITVDNVAPSIAPFGPFSIDEGSPLDTSAVSTDPGSDDLTFTWELELGPTITKVYYNDGIGPDPYPSPGGTFPFTVEGTVQHTYGDNGVFNVTLTVDDDDGGTTSYKTTITVDNVAPTVDVQAYVPVNFTLRITGEKWHNVEMFVYADGEEIGYAEITRYPGNPDEQTVSTGFIKCDITSTITARVLYTPLDDPISGTINGANPVWLMLTFEDDTEVRLKHTFNVQHEETWEWSVYINPYLSGHEITFEATATDPGSDDLTFTWNWGDGSPDNETIYYNDGVGPDPYPSPGGTYPFTATDVQKHTFTTSGVHTVTLTVEDDDGGVESASLTIVIP